MRKNYDLPTKSLGQIFILGAICTILVVAGLIADIIIGSTLGGDLTELPSTAMDRFLQFRDNRLLGLYNLDLLNLTIQIMMIPAYLALYLAHRHANKSIAMFAFVTFLSGTTVFVTNNIALPMLDLSHKYFTATTESQASLIAAAGEAMLARGAHGSPGAFPGFILVALAGSLMSFVMFRGGVFSKITSLFGLAGNLLMLAYLILVTFVPGMDRIAMIIAMPGGLLLLVWMILYRRRLLKLNALLL
jgi:hypothetical protein